MPSQMPNFYAAIGSSENPLVWGQTLQLPEAYAVLEVSMVSGDAREEGISILTRLSRMVNRSSLSRFEITNIMRQVGGEEIKSLVLIIPRGDFVTIAIRGSGQVLMRRGRVFATLLKHQGMITGQVKPGDVLILLSGQASDFVLGKENLLFSENLFPKELAATLTMSFAEHKQTTGVPIGLVASVNASTQTAQNLVKSVAAPKPNLKIPSYKLGNFKKRITELKTNKSSRAKLLASVCIIFFLFSVLLGIYRQKNDKDSLALKQALESAGKLLTEGSALIDVKPDEGRMLLTEAQNLLKPYSGDKAPRGKEGKQAAELLTKVQDTLRMVLRVYENEPQLFFDADFLQKGRSVSAMVVGDDEVAFVDTSTGMVGMVSIPSKDGEIITGGEDYKQTKSLMFKDKTLLIHANDALYKFEAGQENGVKVLSFETNTDIATTFSGNVYALDKAEGDVWRYPAKEAGYAEKAAYFQSDINPDLQTVTNLSIDGSIWMGSTIGKIFRYTQGRDDAFLVRGLETALGNKLQVWASIESDFVYVLDTENNRVVLFNKSGVYKAQYVYPKSFNPTDFGVSERNRKIFLLERGKIFSIGVE